MERSPDSTIEGHLRKAIRLCNSEAARHGDRGEAAHALWYSSLADSLMSHLCLFLQRTGRRPS